MTATGVLRATLTGALLVLLTIPSAEASRDPYQHFFSDSFGDMTEELALAREAGKKGVLVFFEMDECPFCHWMKEHVLSREDVQNYYREHFRCLAVDIEGDLEMVDFQGRPTTQREFSTKANRVRATPVFAFFDSDGRKVHKHTGKTATAEEFLWLGEFVAEAHFESTNFVSFKRERRQARREP